MQGAPQAWAMHCLPTACSCISQPDLADRHVCKGQTGLGASHTAKATRRVEDGRWGNQMKPCLDARSRHSGLRSPVSSLFRGPTSTMEAVMKLKEIFSTRAVPLLWTSWTSLVPEDLPGAASTAPVECLHSVSYGGKYNREGAASSPPMGLLVTWPVGCIPSRGSQALSSVTFTRTNHTLSFLVYICDSVSLPLPMILLPRTCKFSKNAGGRRPSSRGLGQKPLSPHQRLSFSVVFDW